MFRCLSCLSSCFTWQLSLSHRYNCQNYFMSRIIYLGKSLNSGHLTPSLGWRLNTWDRVWSHRVKTNFSLKFFQRRISDCENRQPILGCLAQNGIVHFSGRRRRREGWRMSSAGCHCEGRRPTEIDRSHHRHLWLQCSRAGPAYSEQSLSLSLYCLSPLSPSRTGATVWPGRGRGRLGPSSPHRSPDLSNVRRLIRWVSFWLESLGAKWDKIKKLKYWHRPGTGDTSHQTRPVTLWTISQSASTRSPHSFSGSSIKKMSRWTAVFEMTGDLINPTE